MKNRLAYCAGFFTMTVTACGDDGGVPRGSGILNQTDSTSSDPLVGTWKTAPTLTHGTEGASRTLYYRL